MDLDRIAPSRRAACATVKTGHQTWRDVLFVHWEVPAAALRPLVPARLAIDEFEGRAYVGLVPLTMHDVRFGPLPLPDFLETNLRTYVHADGVPGIWFFSLDAQSATAVWGARAVYGLPYFRARMSREACDGGWRYHLDRAGRPAAALDAQWAVLDAVEHTPVPGTLEHFLTQRFALYGAAPGRGVYRLRVHHRDWPLRRARLNACVTTLPAAAGIAVGSPIDLVVASDGASVETFARERLGA